MYTISLLVLFELVLYTLAGVLPGSALAGGLCLLLVVMLVALSADVVAGYVSRLCYLFAMLWYVGSVGRLAPSLEAVHADAGEPVGLFLSYLYLLVVPLAFLLTAGLTPGFAFAKWAGREFDRRWR